MGLTDCEGLVVGDRFVETGDRVAVRHQPLVLGAVRRHSASGAEPPYVQDGDFEFS